MLARLLPFELKLHFNQVGFWVTATILFLIAILSASTDIIVLGMEGGEKIKSNGAAVVAAQVGLFSFLPILFASMFVVTGMLRDDVAKSTEIVHATPVSTLDMVIARMTGVFCATTAVTLAAVLGLFVGQFAPWIDQEKLGAINVVYYAYPALVLVLVNSAVITALFTTIAALTRNAMMVYTGAIGLLMLYMGVGLFVGEDAPDLVLSLSDPFGMSASQLITEFWPADELNTRLVPLIGYFGLNRLFWLGAAIALLVAMIWFFPRGVVSGRSPARAAASHDLAAPARFVLKKPLSDSVIDAAWSRFRLEYFAVVRSISFAILMLLAMTLFGVTVYASADFVPDPLLPTNAQMATTALGSVMLPLLIMIVFFSGEIYWRDRTFKTLEIIDATRVSNLALMLAKWAALAAVIFTVIAAGMLVGIAGQLIIGGVPLDLSTHFQILVVDMTPGLVMYGGLALFIQNLAPNRIVGMVAAAGAIIFTLFLPQMPFEHPLLRFANLSLGGFSEMNGFEDPLSFHWHLLYWGSLSVVLALAGAWLWRRGLGLSFLDRLRGRSGRLGLVSTGVGVAALGAFIFAGVTLFVGYSVDNTYRNQEQTETYFADLERVLGDRLDDPLPKVRDVAVTADLFPETQSARFSGRYVIENVTGAPLREVFLMVPGASRGAVRALSLDGASQVLDGPLQEVMSREDVRLYRFSPALAPGALATLTFDLETPAPEIGAGSPIRRNGTFVNNEQVLPSIGLRDFRIRNPDVRRKHGLGEREGRPEREDMAARAFTFFGRSADYVTFKASFCTAPGQIPIAPGRMLRAYEKNGRTCRDYEPIAPIANFFAFVSARYALKQDVWTGPNGVRVPLEIYYHPQHAFNIDLMMDAMKQSLTSFTRDFGPYQYSELRIMEFPYASFAQSFAGTIPFSENIGFARDPGEPDDPKRIDLATYVTIHEVAHQWFGHQIAPADVKGFNVLSEGLTEHAAASAYEEAFGWATARRLLEREAMEAYLTGRTGDADKEPPLALAEDEGYLVYSKANWVFWGLRHTMGADRVNAALRAFLAEFGSKGPPYPSTLELVAALRAEAGQQWQQLITDYFDRIVLWEPVLSEDSVRLSQSQDGWIADVRFSLHKVVASEETGQEVSVLTRGETLNEWVEIGFYEKDPKETLGADPIWIEWVRVTAKDGAARIQLDKKPAYVALDPRRILIERNVTDNVVQASPQS